MIKKYINLKTLVATFILLALAFSFTVSFQALAQSTNDPAKMTPKSVEDELARNGKKPDLQKMTLLESKKAKALTFDHKHKLLDTVLKKYAVVEPTLTYIEYAALKKDPDELKTYLTIASSIPRKVFDKWTKNQQIAYLVNYYNANVLKWVIDHYPTKTIRKTVPFYKSVFKIGMFPFFGKKSSLENLEHDFLRPKYGNNPYFHFGVNCAAVGCPPLLGEAFVAEKLDEQFKEGARRFFKNTKINRLDTKKKIIYVSELFDWFEEDWEKNNTNIAKFAADYITDDPTIRAELKAGKYKVKETKYDWNLNDKK